MGLLERLPQKRDILHPEFQPLLQKLPLERCSLERNQTTGELGWRAPKNHAFQITGQFILDSHQSHIEERSRPEDSEELFITNNAGLYGMFLEQAKGDTEKALALLIDDMDELSGYLYVPKSFSGKWLVLSPNIDGSSSFIEDYPNEPATLRVKEDLEVWYDQGYIAGIKNITPGTEKVTPALFKSPEGQVKWQQYYAQGILQACAITLIRAEDEKSPDLYVPEPIDRKKLIFPLDYGNE